MKQPLMSHQRLLVVELNLLNRFFPFRKLSIFMTRFRHSASLVSALRLFASALAFWALSWSASSVTAFRPPLLVFGVP